MANGFDYGGDSPLSFKLNSSGHPYQFPADFYNSEGGPPSGGGQGSGFMGALSGTAEGLKLAAPALGMAGASGALGSTGLMAGLGAAAPYAIPAILGAGALWKYFKGRQDEPGDAGQKQLGLATDYHEGVMSGENPQGKKQFQLALNELMKKKAAGIGSTQGVNPALALKLIQEGQEGSEAKAMSDFTRLNEQARQESAGALASLGAGASARQQQFDLAQQARRDQLYGEIMKGISSAAIKGFGAG